MEGLIISTGLSVVQRHWAGVFPGDTVVVHGESRQVVEIDFDHDSVRVDHPFDLAPQPGDWVVVRHGPA